MPHARKTDPTTSHEAAASVGNITKTQEAILKILEVVPSYDLMLVHHYNKQVLLGNVPMASESGIRSRRAELVERGLVQDSGERVRLASGRHAIVWKAA
jgi:hypothetical protein